jgi:hypothetical protein
MQLSVRMSQRSCCGRAVRGKSSIWLHRKASISRDGSECKGGAQKKLLLDAEGLKKMDFQASKFREVLREILEATAANIQHFDAVHVRYSKGR